MVKEVSLIGELQSIAGAGLAEEGPACTSASRHAYGTPRDFTIGMQVVTADGRITRAGGKVVKNVAGYDLCKLYTGSRGTLGVIVELTFKLAPQPRHEQREALAFDDAATACAFARELERQGMSVKAFTLLNRAATGLPRGGYVLAVDLAGTQAAVNRCWETLSTLAGAA